MRVHTGVRLATTLAAGALALAACGGSSGGGSGAGASAAGSTSGSTGSSATGSAPKSNVKVGLVYDIGGRGDKSFNDAAYAGLQKAKQDLGITYKDLEPASGGQNREQLLRLVAQGGYNPNIGVGFSFQDAVTKVAKDYPKTDFAIIDSEIKAANVASLEFRAEQSSFLVGAVAALKTKSNKVGFIGGVQVPLLETFQAGFDAGVKYVDQTEHKNVTTIDSYLTQPPDFSGFNAPDKGKQSALGMYQQGADIVYAAAGGSGLGVFQAAKQTGNYAIGVDSDQYLSAPADLKGVILTSALKRVDVAVYDYIKSATAGQTWTGVHWFDLSNDGVGISYSGGKIDDIKSKLDAIKQKIVSGQITVPTKPGS